MNGHIDPQWNIQDYVNLKYNRDTVNHECLTTFLNAGHSRDQMCLYNYFEPNIMPASVDYIKSKFNFLKNLTAAVNLVLPGQYMPVHQDLYLKWKTVHNITDTKKIMRVIVMLENNENGQFLQIEKNIYNNWLSGDWYSWVGETEHAVYNFSTKNRYAIQLTGSIS
jgi:hypothetical protein